MTEAERVIQPSLLTVSDFAEEVSVEMKDRIFEEFNTLSVLYQKAASTFVEAQNVAFHEDVLEDEPEEPAGLQLFFFSVAPFQNLMRPEMSKVEQRNSDPAQAGI